MNTNTYALITGGSSGIGRAIAEELASRKINVLLVALPGTGTDEVVAELKQKFSILADGFEIDLITSNATIKVLDWCKLNHYHVNILVNNAGFGNLCSLEKSNPAIISNMMLLNNHALVLLTQLFIPEIKQRKFGYILNVGSLASFMPVPNKSVYAATKSFVYTFSAALRLELLPYHIHVSCLCPGGTLTNEQVTTRINSMNSLNRAFVQLPGEVALEAVTEMFLKKFRVIPGRSNKFLFLLRRILPEFAVDWILNRIFNRSVLKKPAPAPLGVSFALAFR